jgi:hypothetical protein
MTTKKLVDVVTATRWLLVLMVAVSAMMSVAVAAADDDKRESLYALKPTSIKRLDVASPPLLFATSLGASFDTIRVMVGCDNNNADLTVTLTGGGAIWKQVVSMGGAFFTSRIIAGLSGPSSYFLSLHTEPDALFNSNFVPAMVGDFNIEMTWTGWNGTETKTGTIDLVVMIDKLSSTSRDPVPGENGVIASTAVDVNAPPPVPSNPASELRINSTTATLTMAWWPASDADTYIVFALPRPCSLDMQMMEPPSLLVNGTQLWKEVTSTPPPEPDAVLIRDIPWPPALHTGSSYCINVVAYRTGTNGGAASAYCPVLVIDPTWRGPSSGLWAAIGVVIGFIVVTIIGIFVYLHIRTRQVDSFEYVM